MILKRLSERDELKKTNVHVDLTLEPIIQGKKINKNKEKKGT